MNMLFLLSHWKYGCPLSPPADTNLDRATIRPINCCTSFTEIGLRIAMITAHFWGFASIPGSVSRNTKNLPAYTLKMHFSGFNFSLYLAIVVNSSSKSTTCWSFKGRQLHLHMPWRGHCSNPVQSRSAQKNVRGWRSINDKIPDVGGAERCTVSEGHPQFYVPPCLN